MTSWILLRLFRKTQTLAPLDADDAVELSGTKDPGRQWSYLQIGVAGCTLVTRHRVPTSLTTIIIIIIIKGLMDSDTSRPGRSRTPTPRRHGRRRGTRRLLQRRKVGAPRGPPFFTGWPETKKARVLQQEVARVRSLPAAVRQVLLVKKNS